MPSRSVARLVVCLLNAALTPASQIFCHNLAFSAPSSRLDTTLLLANPDIFYLPSNLGALFYLSSELKMNIRVNGEEVEPNEGEKYLES